MQPWELLFPHTSLPLINFLSKRNQLEDWRSSFQVGWNFFTKQVDGNGAQYPLRTEAVRMSCPGGGQLNLSLSIALTQTAASSKVTHPCQGQPTAYDWLMQDAKTRPLASIWDNSEGRFQLQSFLKDQLKAMLWLYHSSTLLSYYKFPTSIDILTLPINLT